MVHRYGGMTNLQHQDFFRNPNQHSPFSVTFAASDIGGLPSYGLPSRLPIG
jgi:hypothetical protein